MVARPPGRAGGTGPARARVLAGRGGLGTGPDGRGVRAAPGRRHRSMDPAPRLGLRTTTSLRAGPGTEATEAPGCQRPAGGRPFAVAGIPLLWRYDAGAPANTIRNRSTDAATDLLAPSGWAPAPIIMAVICDSKQRSAS